LSMTHEQKRQVIYVLHGDDEFAITQAIGQLKTKLGDPSVSELNLTLLDGQSLSIEDFEAASRSMPFLANRRLVVVNNPLAAMRDESSKKRFLDLLEKVPEVNAVVLVEYRPLLNNKEKRDGKVHWLEKWGRSLGQRFFIREYQVPRESQMTAWILERARRAGGQFDYQAADRLTSLVGEDTRLAEQEIIKLLTYVNYERPVVEADVEELTPYLEERNIFELVDALGNRDRKRAIEVFHRLLADQDQQRIFSMIVRQFRYLILAREILDNSGGEAEIIRQLSPSPFRLHSYVARKIAIQARRFSQSQLDAIYHRLFNMDVELKTGVMAVDLSIDLLIADIT
jgi:DNA polymerase-3 subunit delta